MVIDEALLGAVVSVSVWATRVVPVPAGGAVPSAPSIGAGGKNSVLSG